MKLRGIVVWALRFVSTCAVIAITSMLAVVPTRGADSAIVAKGVSSPEVVFQAISERNAVNRKDSVAVSLLILNKSATPLQSLQLSVLPKNPGFEVSLPALGTIFPFGSERQEAKVTAGKETEFGEHHLIFVLQYAWNDGAVQHTSAQTASINVQVNRQFEEEAKGLPGGTAALLYLILPIMAVFFAYKTVESLSKGEGLKFPEFKTEYIAPAFLLAIVLNFVLKLLVLVGLKTDQSFVYGSSEQFSIFLLIAAAAGGAMPPGMRWLKKYMKWRRWAFRDGDGKEEYLRKVLAQSKNGQAPWAKGKCQGQQWEGALLRQPDGTPVLGARLQMSAKAGAGPSYEELSKIVDDKGQLLKPEELSSLTRQGSVNLDFREKVVQAGKRLQDVVVVKGLNAFNSESEESKPIVTLVR